MSLVLAAVTAGTVNNPTTPTMPARPSNVEQLDLGFNIGYSILDWIQAWGLLLAVIAFVGAAACWAAARWLMPRYATQFIGGAITALIGGLLVASGYVIVTTFFTKLHV